MHNAPDADRYAIQHMPAFLYCDKLLDHVLERGSLTQAVMRTIHVSAIPRSAHGRANLSQYQKHGIMLMA